MDEEEDPEENPFVTVGEPANDDSDLSEFDEDNPDEDEEGNAFAEEEDEYFYQDRTRSHLYPSLSLPVVNPETSRPYTKAQKSKLLKEHVDEQWLEGSENRVSNSQKPAVKDVVELECQRMP
jgi:hypothetical protein